MKINKAKIIEALMNKHDILIYPRTDIELVNEFWDNDIEVMLYNLEMESIE
jgi:hypothetical protein